MRGYSRVGFFFFLPLCPCWNRKESETELKYTAFSICILGLFVRRLHTKECKTKERKGPESRVGRKRSTCSEILGVYSFDSKKKKWEKREEKKAERERNGEKEKT